MKGLWALGAGLWAMAAVTSPAQERPLPEAGALFAAVRENLVRAERDTHLYTYQERRTDIHTNPFGRFGTGGTSLFEVYPSPAQRHTYRRLIEKDGRRIPPAELAQQDQRYRSRVADVQKDIAARSAADSRVLEGEAQRARERRQRAVDDVVDTLAFTLRGRATREGIQVIAIDFAGKAAAKPITRQGRIAQKFKGTLYVDERVNEVIALEATSTDDISYGYGMVAKLGEGTAVTLVREPVEGNVWMPTRLTMKGRGRALVVRRLVVDFSIEWFDYRRLPVESLAPFVDPRIQRQPDRRP